MNWRRWLNSLPVLDRTSFEGQATVALFRNDTGDDMRLYLEPIGEEVVLSPGHEVELLARSEPGLLPLTICKVDDGVVVLPDRFFDPDWRIRYQGKVLRPGNPVRLAELA